MCYKSVMFRILLKIETPSTLAPHSPFEREDGIPATERAPNLLLICYIYRRFSVNNSVNLEPVCEHITREYFEMNILK